LLNVAPGREAEVLEEDQQVEEIIARVAALDVGKAELVCCVRVPHEGRPGRRLQEVASYSTMTRSLLRLADRLTELGVTRVVMEATSEYWKPPYYLLGRSGRPAPPQRGPERRRRPGDPPGWCPVRRGVRHADVHPGIAGHSRRDPRGGVVRRELHRAGARRRLWVPETSCTAADLVLRA
jgi:hypothetical protein